MRLESFQMIDAVESLDAEAGSIAVRAGVPTESPVFEGHFPGWPLMPGVLLVEAMAQASGYLLFALGGCRRMPFLASVRQARFRTFVRPGTDLRVISRRDHQGSGYAVTHAQIAAGGAEVADAQLTFREVPFPSPGLKEHMRREWARLGLGREIA